MCSAIIYARVSTDEQAIKGLSIRAQEDVCGAFATREGWPVGATYRDEGLSAGLPLARRPGLLLAIGALLPGSVLVIAKRDRIFRAEPFECAVIERAILSRGARIQSAAGEGTSDDSPASVLMRRLLDGFAEYERLIIRARTKAVLDSKRSRGERVGTIPYGQRLSADGVHVEVDPAEASAIALMIYARKEGRSLRYIIDLLGKMNLTTKSGQPWSAGTVSRILKREGL